MVKIFAKMPRDKRNKEASKKMNLSEAGNQSEK